MRELRRKTHVLMEIAASGEDLDNVIKNYSAEIDMKLIDILEERIKAARR